MANVKDFDAFWAEQKQESIPFKIFGQTEYLPPSLPADLVLNMIRMGKEHGNNDLPQAEAFELAISIFGKGKVDEWSKKGLTVDQLISMMDWAMEQYNPGNRPAPEKGQE